MTGIQAVQDKASEKDVTSHDLDDDIIKIASREKHDANPRALGHQLRKPETQ